ncbi:TPA: phage tail protein [Enterobacter hormaechei subsp. xiangfangensis]
MGLTSGWFKSRLTPSKQNSVMQFGLADIVESLFIAVVEPYLTRISNRKSFFTMDNDDLDTRINEMGQFFTIRSSDASSKPMLLQQRLDEIHFKGTSRPITQTFYREFNGVPITWQPLYAPLDIEKYPYGTVLIAENNIESVGNNFGELWMTSRGVISIPLNDLIALIEAETGSDIQSAAEITEEALTKFKQVVEPLLPLHIVFDGMQLLAEVTLTERSETVWLESIASAATYQCNENADTSSLATVFALQDAIQAAPAALGNRELMLFDEIPADSAVLDRVAPPSFDDHVDIYIAMNDALDILLAPYDEANVSFSILTGDAADSTATELVQYGIASTAAAGLDTGSVFLTQFDNTPHDTSVDYEDAE